ncbi:MAG: hypothetical protein QOG83_2685 [Alphaproteobacteria bacterium]|nr:hypothetical protein [Alphaproteobacteria bacterium]
MRHLALTMSAFTLLLVAASAAMEQPVVPKQKPGPKSVEVRGTYSPERINEDVEEQAKKWQQTHADPALRVPFFKISYARNVNEFAALRRYSVMLLTVLSQKSEELPIKNVYVRANGKDVSLTKVSNWRSDVAKDMLAYKVYGPYREDGFYIIPTGMMMRDGQMLVDFAVNRYGLVMLQLPGTAAPEATKNFKNLDPDPNSKPDLKALQAYIQYKFPGFPVPKSLP